MLHALRPQDPAATYAAVLDALPIVAYMADPEGAFTYLSRGWEQVTGHVAEDVFARGYDDVVHPDDRERVAVAWREARLERRPYRDEYRLKYHDGSYRWMKAQADPLSGFAGRIVGWFGTLTDVQDLRESEARLEIVAAEAMQNAAMATARAHFVERLMESSDDCIKVLDLDARVEAISENGRKALAIVNFESVRGADWLGFWAGDDRIGAERAIADALSGGVGKFTGLLAVLGVDRWWNVRVTPILDAHGTPERLLIVSRDITETRLGLLELTRSIERYKALGEALPGVSWSATPDGKLDNIVGLSVPAGTDTSAFLGDDWLGIVHPDDREQTQRVWQRSIAQGLPYETQFRVQSPAGDYRWQLVRAVPLRDSTAAVTSWVGVNIDFHDQHEALERERRIAITLQEASLPSRLPQISGIELFAYYRPAIDEAMIGGDWYDAFQLIDGRLALTIGDVLGKGLHAAASMGRIRQAMRGAARHSPSCDAMLDAGDYTVRSESSDSKNVYATSIASIYDAQSRTFAFASAGHPGPFLRDVAGTVTELSSPGTLLGLRLDGEDATRSIEVLPGSSIVFVTDGLLEETRDLDAGIDRVKACLAAGDVLSAPDPALALVKCILDDRPASDDIAVLIARFG